MSKPRLLEKDWLYPNHSCLTLRWLMSYIYMEHPFLMFLDHTQRRTTVSRTPLDEWSARSRDLYLTTHNTHNRQTSMPPVGFEPKISADERPQTYDLERAATGTGYNIFHTKSKSFFVEDLFSKHSRPTEICRAECNDSTQTIQLMKRLHLIKSQPPPVGPANRRGNIIKYK